VTILAVLDGHSSWSWNHKDLTTAVHGSFPQDEHDAYKAKLALILALVAGQLHTVAPEIHYIAFQFDAVEEGDAATRFGRLIRTY